MDKEVNEIKQIFKEMNEVIDEGQPAYSKQELMESSSDEGFGDFGQEKEESGEGFGDFGAFEQKMEEKEEQFGDFGEFDGDKGGFGTFE